MSFRSGRLGGGFRQASVCAERPGMVIGHEGNTVEKDIYKGQAIGVFTSGGDSQGMNAAVRAVVRMGLYVGCKVYFIKEGYQGMCDGGDNFVEANWVSVSGILHKGGTVIGSARCKEFRERNGKLKAAKNLIANGISNLVVIGGDGSLTGAHLFRQMWPNLLSDLVKSEDISEEDKATYSHLNIVGMVGSIDNDFCGTDMTIGTDSALHRILEAVDAIAATAYSHQRCFILEVMGRHCGYLALVAGLTSEADYVFIPESPPPEDWQKDLCEHLLATRASGKRLNVIIVSEGAIDREGNPITPDMVKQTVVSETGMDTRVTVLGHVQRGGAPSAFDRILGARMGAEAVLACMEAKPETEPCVISLAGNHAVRVPLMQCVQKTQAVTKAMADRNWKAACELRGKSFMRNLETYNKIMNMKPPTDTDEDGFNMGIIHIGSPCCGMNAAAMMYVRQCIVRGDKVIAMHNGIEGLVEGDVSEISWSEVNGWVGQGGAFLGTTRIVLPNQHLEKIAERFREHNIHSLLIIGGFEAYQSVLQLYEARDKYPEFRIPMAVIPATINNDVPGSDLSIGADTALNEITSISDRCRQSAQGSKRRVFVVETMGGFCGYLTTMASISGGADTSYIFEEEFGLEELCKDVRNMGAKMSQGVVRGLVLRNGYCNKNYTTDFISRLYAEEGKGVFTVRTNVLGHMQQGGTPSAFDRNMGIKMATKVVVWMSETMKKYQQEDGSVMCDTKDSAVLLGLRKSRYLFQPVADLVDTVDWKQNIPLMQWWMMLRPLAKILGENQVDDDYSECGAKTKLY